MRILVINDFGVCGGGTEKRVGLLLEELKKSRQIEEIHLLEHNSANSKISGVKIHKVGSKSIDCFNKAKRIIKENKIDIVQVHNLLLIHPIVILSAKLMQIPVIWFAHDYWPVCGKRSFVDAEKAIEKEMCEQAKFFSCINCIGFLGKSRIKINSSLVNLADVAVSPTDFMKKLFEEHSVCVGKWKKIVPWIDLKKLSRIKKKKKKQIIFVGPLLDYKGAKILAKAFNNIAEKDSAAKLVFIGNHSLQENNAIDEMKKEIKQEFLTRVNFFSETDWKKIQEKVAESTMLIFPTVCMESFGNVWAEAMALATVPIISDTSGLKESAKDHALFFEPKNQRELAEKVLFLLKNKKLSYKMSESAKDFAFKSFKVERAAKEIIGIYNELIK